jgi:division protein CdvB (Snf7/Vps24/ESCRT-III family)
MARFFKNWINDRNRGVKERVKETLSIPSKPRIEIGNSIIELQISKLDNKIAHTRDTEVRIFDRIVADIQSHNDISAKMLSKELANLRHNQRILNQARRTLEQASIRSSTVSDLLEVMKTLEPVISPVKDIKSDVTRLRPAIVSEVDYLQMVTNSVMSESNQNSEMNMDFTNLNNETDNDIDQIMAEASDKTKE